MYSVPQASRHLGISRSAILAWIERDYIRPAVRSLGKGDSTMLSDENLRELRIVARVVQAFGDGERAPDAIRLAVSTLAKRNPGDRAVTFTVEVDVD